MEYHFLGRLVIDFFDEEGADQAKTTLTEGLTGSSLPTSDSEDPSVHIGIAGSSLPPPYTSGDPSVFDSFKIIQQKYNEETLQLIITIEFSCKNIDDMDEDEFIEERIRLFNDLEDTETNDYIYSFASSTVNPYMITSGGRHRRQKMRRTRRNKGRKQKRTYRKRR